MNLSRRRTDATAADDNNYSNDIKTVMITQPIHADHLPAVHTGYTGYTVPILVFVDSSDQCGVVICPSKTVH